MTALRLSGIICAAGLIITSLLAGAAPARAQGPIWIVDYVEVTPSTRNATLPALRALRNASRKELGNTRFEILQRIGQPQHFAILETWIDAKAQGVHAAAAHVLQFRDRLKPHLAAPVDERTHTGFAVSQSKASGAGAVYVVTHVDLIGAKKDEGLAALKQLSADSAKDAGLLRYDVLQQSSRPNHLTLIEVWRGKAAHEKHEVAQHTRNFREQLLPMSGSLYDQRLYQAID